MAKVISARSACGEVEAEALAVGATELEALGATVAPSEAPSQPSGPSATLARRRQAERRITGES
jgi:hypothetical protein